MPDGNAYTWARTSWLSGTSLCSDLVGMVPAVLVAMEAYRLRRLA